MVTQGNYERCANSPEESEAQALMARRMRFSALHRLIAGLRRAPQPELDRLADAREELAALLARGI